MVMSLPWISPELVMPPVPEAMAGLESGSYKPFSAPYGRLRIAQTVRLPSP